MIKLIDLLNEIIAEGAVSKTLDADLNKSEESNSPFLLNTSSDFRKIKGVETYYGITRNPGSTLSVEETTEIYNDLKNSNVSSEILNRIVLSTAPSVYIKYIMVLPSSSKLNMSLVDILQQKYKVQDDNILTNISKIEYFIDDMINKEKYGKADPTTQKMADTWVKSLKKHYGADAPKMPIKKSGNKETGHPGIQTGARHLLNPVYKVEDDWKVGTNVLVVDDFLIGGSSMREIYTQLIDRGIPTKNIKGYCLGIKSDEKRSIGSGSIDKNPAKDLPSKDDPIGREIKQIEAQIKQIESDPVYLDLLGKLQKKPQSEFLQAKTKEFEDKIKQLEDNIKDAKTRQMRLSRYIKK